MSDRPHRFGADSIFVPAILVWPGDPEPTAWRAQHPDSIAIPCRWRGAPPGRPGAGGSGGAGHPPTPGLNPILGTPELKPLWQPSATEFLALAAALRAEAEAGTRRDAGNDLLVYVNRRRGLRLTPMPGGGARVLSVQEQLQLYRFHAALNRIRAAEPGNRQLTFMTAPNTLPAEEWVLRLEAEASRAEARASGLAAPAGPANTLPGVPLPTDSIVAPGGVRAGQRLPGSGPDTTTVLRIEFTTILSKLRQGAKQIPNPNYDGQWFKREDGTDFGLRQSSLYGLTLDIQATNHGLEFRIHR